MTIPFASFVYFCCRDNAYMNAYANSPARAVSHLREQGLAALLLRPGERYAVGSDPAPYEDNLAFYERVAAQIPSLPLDEPERVTTEALDEAWGKLVGRLRATVSPWLLRWVPDVTFWVEDLGMALRASLRRATLERPPLEREVCSVWVNSRPLWFGFEYPFGLETLGVSARYRVNRDFRAWKVLKNLSILNNQEVHLNARFLFSNPQPAYLTDRVRGGLLRQLVRKSWRAMTLRVRGGRAA